ncbi:MAG: phosphate ABC transporter substrate-binding protein PstS [bacterium]
MTRSKMLITIISVLVLIAGIAGCKGGNANPDRNQASTGGSGDTQSQTDNWKGIKLGGAGATFPAPIYTSWAYIYEEQTGLMINYQSIGSGAGIAQIKAKTVDFGASDAPLEVAELDGSGLIQFPMIIGGVVPVLNLPGIASGQLKLTGELLADIFLGTVKKWNDPAIKALNPDVNLPDLPIIVVHRADGSGTTWIFTSYLDTISPKWHAKVGAGKSVEWPAGNGGQGNEGVSSYMQQLKGSIGYVEFAYAVQNQIVYAQLKNKAGTFVAPSVDTFQAAASNADWANAPGYYMVLVDQPGDQSWPITGASFIIVYKQQDDMKKSLAMLSFFDWCYRYGQKMATEMDYVPVPDSVVEMIENSWREDITAAGGKVWQ